MKDWEIQFFFLYILLVRIFKEREEEKREIGDLHIKNLRMIQELRLQLKSGWGFKCTNWKNKRESRKRKRKQEREAVAKKEKERGRAKNIQLFSIQNSFYYRVRSFKPNSISSIEKKIDAKFVNFGLGLMIGIRGKCKVCCDDRD